MCLNHPASCLSTLHTLLALRAAVVREGLRRFDVLEPPRTSAEAPCTPCFPCNKVEKVRYFRTTPPSCDKTTPCFLCAAVVREGSSRFYVLELPRTTA